MSTNVLYFHRIILYNYPQENDSDGKKKDGGRRSSLLLLVFFFFFFLQLSDNDNVTIVCYSCARAAQVDQADRNENLILKR